MVPPHSKAADSASDKATVEVLALRLRRRSATPSTALTRAVVGGRTGHYGLELLFGHEGWMRWLLGPDPGLRWVLPVARGLPGPTVPHLITRVLGVPKHLPDARSAPRPERAGGIHRDRRRIAVRIGVEGVTDLGDAEGYQNDDPSRSDRVVLTEEPADEIPAPDLGDLIDRGDGGRILRDG